MLVTTELISHILCNCRWGYCILSNRYQPTRSSGLGHDAVMFWPPLYVGTGETREVWWAPAVLCHSTTHWVKETGGKLCI